MKTITNIFLMFMVFFLLSCKEESSKSTIHLREEVRSDDIGSNMLTRPVGQAFSALIGEGIEIRDVKLVRNDSGFPEVHILGYNRSPGKKRFEIKVEWLDKNGFMIDTKTTTWLPVSAMGHSEFNYKAVAPRQDATDYRIDTRKLRD